MQWLQSANAMATKPFHPRSATDIRLRAERRAGDLLREMADRGERDTGYGDRKSESHAAIPKLKDLVVTKTQSSRWHRVGLLDADGREVRAAAGAEPCNGKLTLQIKDGWLSRCSRRERELHRPGCPLRSGRSPGNSVRLPQTCQLGRVSRLLMPPKNRTRRPRLIAQR